MNFDVPAKPEETWKDELERLSYLWDGTENWVLNAFHHNEADLTIVFAGERPSIQEIIAVRKLLEKYRDMPVQQLKAQIGDSPSLALGKRWKSEAKLLVARAIQLGLSITSVDASFVGYLPINQTEDYALVIEDDTLAALVSQRMLAAGVPVVEEMHIGE